MQRSYVSKYYSIRTPQSQNWLRSQNGYAHPCGKQDELLTRIRHYWVNYEDPSRPNFYVNAREFSRLAWATTHFEMSTFGFGFLLGSISSFLKLKMREPYCLFTLPKDINMRRKKIECKDIFGGQIRGILRQAKSINLVPKAGSRDTKM